MSDMERLTMTSDKGGVAFTFDLDITCKPSEAQKILRLAEKLKHYEDLAEQGRLVELPCGIGDIIYYYDLGNYGFGSEEYCAFENEIDGIQIFIENHKVVTEFISCGFCYRLDDLGKTWFLSKAEAEAEAEAKVKELEG